MQPALPSFFGVAFMADDQRDRCNTIIRRTDWSANVEVAVEQLMQIIRKGQPRHSPSYEERSRGKDCIIC